jgi:hypothetical protein
MASAHFGTGDKSKWGYLGSRKAVYDEWKSGKTLPKLAKLFNVTQGVRWSRFPGQFGGKAKMESGFDYAASFSSFSCIA